MRGSTVHQKISDKFGNYVLPYNFYKCHQGVCVLQIISSNQSIIIN